MKNITQNTNLIPVENTNNELPKNVLPGLQKDNSSIDFYLKIDKNYVPVAGANKILPVEYVYSFSGIAPEELIGVRSVVKETANKKKIEFNLFLRDNYFFKYNDFEVVLYQSTGKLFEPKKILRLLRKEYNSKPEASYVIKNSQRNYVNRSE